MESFDIIVVNEALNIPFFINTKRITSIIKGGRSNQSINGDRQLALLALSKGPMRAAYLTDAAKGTGSRTLIRRPRFAETRRR